MFIIQIEILYKNVYWFYGVLWYILYSRLVVIGSCSLRITIIVTQLYASMMHAYIYIHLHKAFLCWKSYNVKSSRPWLKLFRFP